MRRAVLALLRRALAGARRLDRADPGVLRLLSPARKRRLLQGGVRLAAPFLPRVVSVDGVRLAAPRSHLMGYVLSPHEPALVQRIQRRLRPGDVAVDVGANVGYLTVQMARCVGPEGTVHALEPAPDNLVWLMRNVTLNDARQVHVLAVAAGAEPRLRSLHLAGSTRNSFYVARSQPASWQGPVLEVPQVRLDDIHEGPVDLVKIDVEGAELEVLQGMQRILADSPRLHLLVEWNPEALRAAGQAEDAVPAFLAQRGLQVRRIGTGGQLERLDPDRVPERGHVNLCAFRETSAPT